MANEIWTIKRCLEWTKEYLAERGEEHPRLSAEWLLCAATGLARIDLYMRMDETLDAAQLETMHAAVVRRAKGEPLQYITGSTQFRMIDVACAPGVLIPRPETEVLVSEALACLPPRKAREATWNAEAAEQERAAVAEIKRLMADATASAAGADAPDADDVAADAPDGAVHDEGGDADTVLVVDVCTGSGCIACAMAQERDDVRVIAVDLAPEAVLLARENAAALGLDDAVKVVQGDLLTPVPARYAGRVDVVVSNPPYVPTAVLADIPHEVAAFEPTLALDGGADGLDLFRRLLPQAFALLKVGGAFACELHETCLEAAARLAADAGFVEPRIVRDLTDRPRVLICRKPQ